MTYMKIDDPKNHIKPLISRASIIVYLKVFANDTITLNSLGGSSFSALKSRVHKA